MSYARHVAFWAQRGRALTSELVGGNREKLTGAECGRIATRALSLLAAGHGPATFRIDSAYYQREQLKRLRRDGSRFTVVGAVAVKVLDPDGRLPVDIGQDEAVAEHRGDLALQRQLQLFGVDRLEPSR